MEIIYILRWINFTFLILTINNILGLETFELYYMIYSCNCFFIISYVLRHLFLRINYVHSAFDSIGHSKMYAEHIQASETTFSHVTFAADPLVFEHPHLLTFSSRKSSFTMSMCVSSNVAYMARGYTCEFWEKSSSYC